MNFCLKEAYLIDDLIQIMGILRGENGCPWDSAQTHTSIRKNLLEEAYETAEAIDKDDSEMLKEELGDVLLQVVFHSEISKENGEFDFNDICDGICKKLIFRHPHVFGNVKAGNEEEALENWNSKKLEEKGQSEVDSLNSVAKSLPALMYAEKVLSRAEKLGIKYEMSEVLDSMNNFMVNMGKIRITGDDSDCLELQEKIGEILFNIVKFSKFYGIDPENSLTSTVNYFIKKCST